MSLNEKQPLQKFTEVAASFPTRKEVKKGALYIGRYREAAFFSRSVRLLT